MTRHVAAALVATSCLAPLAVADDWPQWRGPELRGTSRETGLPLRWSTTEGIAWKLALPSGSGSTPVVVGDHVYLNVADGDTVFLWCVDRKTGAIAWKRPLGPSVGHAHRKHNMSTPSPVTGGGRVYAMTGTGVLKGFEADGHELWSRDLQKEYGAFGLNWGYGSSPLLFEGALYVPVLQGMKTDDPSYLLAVDAATGEATMRKLGSFVGFKPWARHFSWPVAGSCPVTTSPPVNTISAASPRRARVGVV